MSHKSKLSEWREYLRTKREQEKLQANIDCHKVADVVLEKLIATPFDTKYGYSHFVYVSWNHYYKNRIHATRGECDFDSFKTIMKIRCKAAFGEECVVVDDFDSWNVGFWERN